MLDIESPRETASDGTAISALGADELGGLCSEDDISILVQIPFDTHLAEVEYASLTLN